MYVLDVDTDVAKWVSTGSAQGDWSGQYVSGREDLGDEFPVVGDDVCHRPGPDCRPAGPDGHGPVGQHRRRPPDLTLLVQPQRDVRLVYLELPGASVATAKVQGRDVPAEFTGDNFGVLFPRPAGRGHHRRAGAQPGPGPTNVRVMDGSDGLAGLPGFTPRPADVTAEGSHDSELVVVAKTYSI